MNLMLGDSNSAGRHDGEKERKVTKRIETRILFTISSFFVEQKSNTEVLAGTWKESCFFKITIVLISLSIWLRLVEYKF